MRATVSALLSANKSFLIMALSSLLYFAATFLAKKTMTEDDFYYWNVLLTVSAISYSFCCAPFLILISFLSPLF